MLRNRLIISLVVVLVGLGSILFLPKSFGLKDAAVFDALPGRVGEWKGEYRAPGKKEKDELDKATVFRKRFYYRDSPNHPRQADAIDATMVQSGDDMNNSIHRPERCLKAQGYHQIEPKTVKINVGDKSMKVTRLRFVQTLADGTELPALMYYWFVGADHLTNSHYERTLYDIKHRLLQGTNQRWAYISLLSQFGPGWAENGVEWLAPNTEEEADAYMQDFIKRTFFQIHKADEINGWEEVAEAG
ncbi:MAG: exosortase-associated EpsI family protein [Verrucomicrobiales bacterium]